MAFNWGFGLIASASSTAARCNYDLDLDVTDATPPAGFGRPDLTAFASYPNRL